MRALARASRLSGMPGRLTCVSSPPTGHGGVHARGLSGSTGGEYRLCECTAEDCEGECIPDTPCGVDSVFLHAPAPCPRRNICGSQVDSRIPT